MSQTPMKQAGPARPSRYTIKQQRVKYANFWVKKDDVLDRPGPSWTSPKLSRLRSEQIEPWNVENIRFSGKGIEVFQFAARYNHANNQPGGKVLTEDELSWSMLFKPESMRNICVREMNVMANEKHKRPSTMIEVCFKYEGLPESKDSTVFKTKQAEEGAAMDDAEGVQAEEGQEGEISKQGEEVGGEEAVDEPVEEVEMAEAEEVEEEEVLPTPDQFDLAKLFAEPNDFKNLEVRIAFPRSDSKHMPWRWMWPAVFAFLRGFQEWAPHSKKEETERRVRLPLNTWVAQIANKDVQRFAAQRQGDGTTEWRMRETQESSTNTAVPAFGGALPIHPQAHRQRLPPPQPAITPAPAPSESSKGPKKRTLEELEAEEDEIDRGLERLLARRRENKEARREISSQ